MKIQFDFQKKGRTNIFQSIVFRSVFRSCEIYNCKVQCTLHQRSKENIQFKDRQNKFEKTQSKNFKNLLKPYLKCYMSGLCRFGIELHFKSTTPL